MNDSKPDHDSHWEDLVRRASRDRPPSTDIENVIRALRREPAAVTPSGWFESFGIRFTSPRIAGLACAAALFALSFTAWESWDSWQDLAWVEAVSIDTGDLTS